MHDLAQELVDHIIDCVFYCWNNEDDPGAAMKSCGAVCKRWLRRSRYHFFSEVYLTCKNLRSFVDAVDTSALPLLSFVRHLTLEYRDRPPNTTLLNSIHQCPNLSGIAIHIPYVYYDSRNRATAMTLDWLGSEELLTHLRSWSTNSPSISTFELKSSPPMRLPHRTFINLMSCFPSIGSLVLEDAAPWAETIPPNSFTPLRLTSVSLDYSSRDLAVCTSFLFAWLLSLPVVPNMTALKLRVDGCADGDDWAPIAAYIRETGEGIECLDLDMQQYIPQPGLGHRLGKSLFGKF
jgi:hypothetical protein